MVEDSLAEEILQGRYTSGSEVRISKKGDTLQFVDANGDSEPPVDQEEEVVDQDKA